MKLLLALLLATPAAAQSEAWTVLGANQGDHLGHALASAGDRDADGVNDLLVGSPESDLAGPASGQVTLLSGASGAILLQLSGLSTGDRAGRSVAALGDINGDGIPDLAYGAPTRSVSGPQMGAVYVASGSDGSQLLSYEGSTPYGVFGYAIANAGDLDGDGRDDLLIGAPNEDPNGQDSGAVYAFSTGSQNGSAIHILHGANPGDRFGSMVLSVGDTNSDGIPDFLVGSPDETAAGATTAGGARLYSGADMSPLGAWFGSSANARFGSAACALGDWNSDGHADFAIGAPGGQDPSTGTTTPGRVELRSGADGSLFLSVDGPPDSSFGTSLDACGDVDSDGLGDLLVGAPGAGFGGEVLTLSGLDGATLATTTATQANAQHGHALASLSSPSHIGAPEWAASAPLQDSTTGADHGAVTLYSDSIQLGSVFCAGDGSATPCPCGNVGAPNHGCANAGGPGAHLRATGSTSTANSALVFLATDLSAGEPTLLYTGINRIQAGMGFTFGDGLRCAGGAVYRLGVRFADSNGSASWGPTYPNAPWSAGTERHFQAWYRNNLSPACGTGFNLSNGYTILFTP